MLGSAGEVDSSVEDKVIAAGNRWSFLSWSIVQTSLRVLLLQCYFLHLRPAFWDVTNRNRSLVQRLLLCKPICIDCGILRFLLFCPYCILRYIEKGKAAEGLAAFPPCSPVEEGGRAQNSHGHSGMVLLWGPGIKICVALGLGSHSSKRGYFLVFLGVGEMLL